MRRRKLSRKGSRRLFSRTARKTKRKNVVANLSRGGIQL